MNTTARAIEDAQMLGVINVATELEDDRSLPSLDLLAKTGQSLVEALDETISDSSLEWVRDEFLWALTNSFHHLSNRFDREQDRNGRKIQDLAACQDGSEIRSVELEQAQAIGQCCDGKVAASEALRDGCADAYKAITGSPWLPRGGSKPAGPAMTGAVVNALDYLKAQKQAKIERFLPKGTPVALTGHSDYQDHPTVWAALDKARAKHADMVLLTTGGRKGADMIAAKWAAARGVDLVFFAPNFTKHGKAAAPHKRNDELLAQRPAGLIVFRSINQSNGIIDNLAAKAQRAGIHVWSPTAATLH